MSTATEYEKAFDIMTEPQYDRQKAGFGYGGTWLQNPDPVLQKIAKNITLLRNLLYDPHVCSVVESRKSGTRTLHYRLAGTENCSAEVNEYFYRLFDTLDIPNLINQFLDARFFGMSVIELCCTYDNGYWHVTTAEQRNVEWFHFNTENKLEFIGASALDPEPIPDLKVLLLRNNATYANPYGEALLSKIYWSCVFKRDAMNAWLATSEKYGSPFMIGKYKPGMTAAQKQDALDDMIALVKGGVGLVPIDLQLDIMQANNANSANMFDGLITLCNSEISKAITGSTLTTEIGTNGSYAVGRIHAEVKASLISDDILFVQAGFQKLIKKLGVFNFGNVPLPYFLIDGGLIGDKNDAQRDVYLSQIGVRFKEKHFIESYGIPDTYFDLVAPVFPGAYTPDQTQQEKIVQR